MQKNTDTGIEEVLFTRPLQKRGEMTVDNIFSAAKDLIKTGEPDMLSSRELSKRSGYSIGSIYHYFKKIDDVFLSLFIQRRNKTYTIILEKVQQHDPAQDVEIFIKMIVDTIFCEFKKNNNPQLTRWIIRQFLKRSKEPEKLGAIIDSLVPSVLQLIARDTTGTFAPLSETEARLKLRAIQVVIRSPFFECDPMAGTEEHYNLSCQVGIRLFKTNP